ncbi:unnamed protein product, partial [Ectocarpus sp. 12 AP-2014]
MECIWVGWPGTYVEPGRECSLTDQLKDRRLVPIFLDAAMEDRFYEGFCKTILWPLFHSSMPTTEDTIACHDADSIEEQREESQLWLAYKAANQSFADTIQDVYRDGDLIWVHDYHLTMLPQMLRNVLPSAKIGFFLHLPFPSSEGVEHNGHFANVTICPVGIDPDAVTQLCHQPDVMRLMQRWSKQTRNKTMLLGVDSLDATRGLVQKFLAVEEMFEMQPGLADKVNFVQVCFTGPHSRERMVLEAQVQGFVARVNSKLGSIDEAGPVQFFLNVNPN